MAVGEGAAIVGVTVGVLVDKPTVGLGEVGGVEVFVSKAVADAVGVDVIAAETTFGSTLTGMFV